MTATVVATAEPTAIPPRVRLDVTTSATSIALYRVAVDGTRTPVRSYDGGPFPVTAGTLVAYDPEVPFDLPVTYTADGSGVTGSAAVTVTDAASRAWLVHPGVPSRSSVVALRALSARSYDANLSVRYPLARRYPIAASDGRRKAATYEMTLITETLADLGPLELLLNDLSPLLLNVPGSLGFGQPAEYVSVGKVTCGRLVQVGDIPYREWTLSCSVVARPPGGSQVDNTYGKSLSLYATYAARYAAQSTYGLAFDP